MTRFAASVRRAWDTLGWIGRSSVALLLILAVVLMLTASHLASKVRDHLVAARGTGVDAVADVLSRQMPDLVDSTPLSATELHEIRIAVRQALPSALFVKIWGLDGTILYADDPTLIGQTDPDARSELQAAMAQGAYSRPADPESLITQRLAIPGGKLVEHYVSIHDGTQAEAVLKAYEEVGHVDEALSELQRGVMAAYGLGAALIVACALVFVVARHREVVRTSARDFGLMRRAAEATAGALSPEAVVGLVQSQIGSELRLERLVLSSDRTDQGELVLPLQDGRLLIADRSSPLTARERDILEAVARTVDTAIGNQALFDRIRGSTTAVPTGPATASWDDLAGELHDTVGAQLIRTLYAVRRGGMVGARQAEGVADTMARIESMVAETEAQLRAFLARVLAQDTAGAAPRALDLRAAITRAVGRFSAESGIRAVVRSFGDAEMVSPDGREVILALVEEGLLNAWKHADASRVTVALVIGTDAARVRVADDGTGCVAMTGTRPGRGIGTPSLRRRTEALGGALTLRSDRRGGTRLEATLPVMTP